MPEKISDRMSENMSGQMSHRMPVGVGHSKEIFSSNVENPGRDHTAFGLFEVGGAVRMGGSAPRNRWSHTIHKVFWELFLHSLLFWKFGGWDGLNTWAATGAKGPFKLAMVLVKLGPRCWWFPWTSLTQRQLQGSGGWLTASGWTIQIRYDQPQVDLSWNKQGCSAGVEL